MKTFFACAALAGATALAAPVSAATIISEGTVYCESASQLLGGAASSCDVNSGDFSNVLTNPSGPYDIEGSATILGYVLDQGSNASQYQDYAKIILNKLSKLTFELFETQQGFDAQVGFNEEGGPTDFENAYAGDVLSGVFGPGTYIFSVDATLPTNSSTDVASNYRLEISAVPVPAGLPLLAAGLGVMGYVGRRKKAKKA